MATNEEVNELRARETECFYNNLGTLRGFMMAVGCTSIEVEFSGGGDSGQVDCVTPTPEFKSATKPQILASFPEITWVMEDDQRQRSLAVVYRMTDWDKVAESIAMLIADRSNVDWYNDEGGRGAVVITPNGLDAEVAYYVIERVTGYSFNSEEDEGPVL